MKQMPQPSDKDDTPDESATESVTESAAASPMVDLEKAELPDTQSLADAIKNWQSGESEVEGELDAGAASDNAAASPWGEAKSDKASTGKASGGKASEKKISSGKATASKASSGKRVSRNQARRYARQRALQALYQWDVGSVELSDVLSQFKENQNLSNVDLDHFERLFRGVALAVDEIDVHLTPALDRPITDLDPIERSILRLSTCELRDCLQTPARVAINEAVELTKRFGADQGHKYVNGVIDKVALALRETEMKAGKKS